MKERTPEDGLPDALRALAREEAGDVLTDPRWDALARGDLGDADRDELERLAAGDPLAREALALFQPLGEEAEARYAAKIAAEIAAGRARAAPRASDDASARPRAPRRAWLPGRIAPVVAALAAAAAVAIVALRRPDTALDRALPTYVLTFAGGERDDRGDPPPATPVLGQGSRFTMTLRPEAVEAGPLGARVFLVQGGRAEPVEAEARISEDGAVRLAGRLGARVSPGDAELVAVVARPDALPSPPVDASALAGEGGRRRSLRQRVRIAGAP